MSNKKLDEIKKKLKGLPIYARNHKTHGIVYRADFNRGLGKAYSKTFKNLSDAKEWLRKEELKKCSSSLSAKWSNKSLRELAEHWFKLYEKSGKAPATIVRNKQLLVNQVLPVLGNKKLKNLESGHIDTWFTNLTGVSGKELSPKSKNHCLSVLKQLLGFALDRRYIQFNPADPIKFVSIDTESFDYWSLEEGEKVLDYLNVKDPKIHVLFAIAFYCGLRKGEIAALNWSVIDLKDKKIHVKHSYCEKSKKLKSTKNKKPRTVPINDTLHEILLECQTHGFTEFKGKGLEGGHASRLLKSVADKVGVKAIKFHDLRHSFASNFVYEGGDLKVLKEIMGHYSVLMTEKYAHFNPEKLKGSTDCLNRKEKSSEECGQSIAEGNVIKVSFNRD